ncbi:MAG: Flp/Fap pilin component [Pseudonocardiales bacterium]|jgi:pilus assembly protein Flp/PilA|nr:Flp/Fap pilin component [Pseudonocardiales bacterium]
MTTILVRMFLMAQIALSDLGDRARQHDNERGATAVEYGLLVALIAGVIIAIVTLLGAKIGAIFTDITGKL